ncbi:MAG TPA: hypothetical protein VGO50_20190 [Pyrinomonadaceae bacterium]|nr:hypothetical protein [Pyrinomonadaceae bacterium]
MLNIKPGYPFVFILTFVLICACAGGVDAQSKRSKKPVKKTVASKDGQAPPTLKPPVTGKAKAEGKEAKEAPAKTAHADPTEKSAEKAAAPSENAKTESKDASPQTETKEKSAAVSSEPKTDAKAEPKQNPATANPKAEVKEKAAAPAKTAASSKKKAKGKPVVAAEKSAAAAKVSDGVKTSTAKKVELKVEPKKEVAKETAVAEKKTGPKKATAPATTVTAAKKAEPKKKITVAGVTVAKGVKKAEPKKNTEAPAPAKPKPEETVLAAAPSKTWLPPIGTDKLRADLNGKTVADIPSEETGDGTVDWLFVANQPKDVEIVKVDRNEDERVIEARLSAKKTHPNLDGSFERVRGTARFHYERSKRGWELLYVENISLRHSDTAPATVAAKPVESPAQKPTYIAPVNTGVTTTVASVISTPPVNIISGASVNIGAGKYQSYSFQVRDTALLTGKFRAQGGPQNDIEAYILDQDGFLNWTNNRSAPAYYNSGRLTVGNIDTVLGAGTYYLVFNNRYSQDDRKTVEASLQLRTDQASLANVNSGPNGAGASGVGTITTVRRTYAPSANPVQPYTRRDEAAETVAVKKPAPTPVQQISEVAGYKDEVVLSDRFDIGGGQHYAIPFSVNSGGAVRGTFNVAGGEIDAYIMTAAQYNKWNATREGVLDYSSGRVSGGSITRSLNPGDYYLVFSNRYSPREPKTVRAQIQVEYLPR